MGGQHQNDTNADLQCAIDRAAASYQHSEAVVQSRLYNYLVAATILLGAWAAFSSPEWWNAFSRMVIALLGLVLSVLWAILGSRERKFLTLQGYMLDHLEKQLPNRVKKLGLPGVATVDLQDGKKIYLPGRDEDLQLNWAEQRLKSRNLLVWSPALFGAAFLMFFARSLWVMLKL